MKLCREGTFATGKLASITHLTSCLVAMQL